jgi:hypothetical protein
LLETGIKAKAAATLHQHVLFISCLPTARRSTMRSARRAITADG